ncbi:MAG: ion channel [Rudaea sp.]|nr:ion channel [Rudaea sp.]
MPGNRQTYACATSVLAATAVFFSGAARAQQVSATGYDNWGANFVVVAVTAMVVCVCVLLHYEALSFLSRWLARLGGQHRRRVLFAIFGVLSVHIVEIWIFALACTFLLLSRSFGTAHGYAGGILDGVYVSSMTFTTVGAGDAYLSGPIRFLVGTEALTGLVLITWSASFTFLEMERFWRDR